MRLKKARKREKERITTMNFYIWKNHGSAQNQWGVIVVGDHDKASGLDLR